MQQQIIPFFKVITLVGQTAKLILLRTSRDQVCPPFQMQDLCDHDHRGGFCVGFLKWKYQSKTWLILSLQRNMVCVISTWVGSKEFQKEGRKWTLPMASFIAYLI